MKKEEVEKVQNDGFTKERNDSWKCSWSHKWSRWSDPYNAQFFTINDGKKLEYSKQMQKRVCFRCNLVEIQEV